MYYFTLSGVSCSCDALEELQAVFAQGEREFGAVAWIGDEGDKLNVLLKKKTKPIKLISKMEISEKEARAAKKPAKREARYIFITRTPQELKDLPFIKDGITWAVAHKWAKKLGRDDIAQLRSDLTQRKKLPK
jgi:hypothetical protein